MEDRLNFIIKRRVLKELHNTEFLNHHPKGVNLRGKITSTIYIVNDLIREIYQLKGEYLDQAYFFYFECMMNREFGIEDLMDLRYCDSINFLGDKQEDSRCLHEYLSKYFYLKDKTLNFNFNFITNITKPNIMGIPVNYMNPHPSNFRGKRFITPEQLNRRDFIRSRSLLLDLTGELTNNLNNPTRDNYEICYSIYY